MILFIEEHYIPLYSDSVKVYFLIQYNDSYLNIVGQSAVQTMAFNKSYISFCLRSSSCRTDLSIYFQPMTEHWETASCSVLRKNQFLAHLLLQYIWKSIECIDHDTHNRTTSRCLHTHISISRAITSNLGSAMCQHINVSATHYRVNKHDCNAEKVNVQYVCIVSFVRMYTMSLQSCSDCLMVHPQKKCNKRHYVAVETLHILHLNQRLLSTMCSS